MFVVYKNLNFKNHWSWTSGNGKLTITGRRPSDQSLWMGLRVSERLKNTATEYQRGVSTGNNFSQTPLRIFSVRLVWRKREMSEHTMNQPRYEPATIQHKLRGHCMNENWQVPSSDMWRRAAWQKSPTAATSRICDIIRCTLRMRAAHWWDNGSVFTGFLVRVTKPSGYYTYSTTSFNIQKFYVLSTVYWCVLCGSENKQRLFPYTILTDWFL